MDSVSVTLSQDEPGESRAAAQIDQARGFRRDESGKLGRVPDMAAPDIVQRARGDQVVSRVPFAEQADIGLQPRQCFT